MTPQEKAQELVTKFGDVEIYIYQEPKDVDCTIYDISSRWWTTKQCALIAVDEIINNFGSLTDGKSHYCDHAAIKYYTQVKQEIENI